MLSEAVAAALAAEFSARVASTARRSWKAMRTVRYRYFLEKLMHVRPLDEIELEVDYARRGQMAHDLLAVVHRRVNEVRGGPESPAALPLEDFARILEEAAAEVFAASGGDSLADALREIDRRKVLQWLGRVSRATRPLRRASGRTATARRGRSCSRFPSASLCAKARARLPRRAPLEFTAGGETVRLSGRIDRIDVGQAGGKPDLQHHRLQDRQRREVQRRRLPAWPRPATAHLRLGRRRTDSQ